MLNSEFARSFGVGAIVALAVVGGVIFAQPFLTRNKRLSFNCQNLDAIPTSFRGSGFLMSKPIGFGPNSMQFVIRPNSVAFLEISYSADTGTVQNIHGNSSQYFTPVRYWYNLATNQVSLTDTKVGLMAVPVNVTVTGTDTLIATYEISASASAQDGAYIGTFWSTCGPEVVLTIGDSYYTGPGLGGTYN